MEEHWYAYPDVSGSNASPVKVFFANFSNLFRFLLAFSLPAVVIIQLQQAYTNLPGYCRSSVMNFFSGSIGVTALVSVTESSTATLADVTQHLTNAIDSNDFLLGSDLTVNPNPSVVPAGKSLV